MRQTVNPFEKPEMPNPVNPANLSSPLETRGELQTPKQHQLSKVCPRCRKVNQPEARICDCGFWFMKPKLIEQAAEYEQPGKDRFKRALKKLLVIACFVIAFSVCAAFLATYTDLFQSFEDRAKRSSLEETSGEDDIFSSNRLPKGKIEGKVVAVTSGDAITVLDQNNQPYQIKLGGIIAPAPDENFGAQSKENLAALILDKNVTVNLQKMGESGQIYGKVFLDGQNINLEQLKAGLARHDKNIEQLEDDRILYTKAETDAKSALAGLWASPDALAPPENQTALNSETESKVPENKNELAEPTAEEVLPSTFVQETPSPVQTPYNSAAANVLPTASATPADNPAASQPTPGASSPSIAETKPTVKSSNATARCGDGTLSYSASRSGACSNHGGVAAWLDGSNAPVKTDPATRTYIRGPRGGCYYLNANGKKTYVDQSMCN